MHLFHTFYGPPKVVFNVAGEEEQPADLHEGFKLMMMMTKVVTTIINVLYYSLAKGNAEEAWITTFLGLLVTSKIRHNIPLCFLTPLSWTHWEDFGSSFRIRTPASGKFTFLAEALFILEQRDPYYDFL